MKTKKEVISSIDKEMGTYDGITGDIVLLSIYARKIGYSFGAIDIFAIGFMCAKYGVTSLFDEEQIRKAIDEYDKTDELKLFDTIGECFIDMLDYQPNK